MAALPFTDGAGVHRAEGGYAKSADTRARLLTAALAEASERGFMNTSVARIADRADLAVGSVHYHFGSRGDLLRELMQELMLDLSDRLAGLVLPDGADFFDRSRAELLAFVEYLRRNPAHVRLADEIKLLEPDLYRDGMSAWVDELGDRIRAGIADGVIREMDDLEVDAQAHFLLGARHFLEELLHGGDASRDAAVVEAYLGLIRHGLSR
ncbi:MAG: TetR/AcrR family transcriptional regulator [Acidimicrobiia bacterium]|nr:TetR/AcrR family transcriptional regulator [Acidimicrobiia bacterium]